jgi:hypothetical protein
MAKKRKMAHTPGPLYAVCRVENAIDISTTPEIEDRDPRNVLAQIMAPDGEDIEDNAMEWANAHLFAAAPELLEALQAMLDSNERILKATGVCVFDKAVKEQAEAVVKKATGVSRG